MVCGYGSMKAEKNMFEMKVIRCIRKMQELHLNDSKFSEYYDELIELLSFSCDETIALLKELSYKDLPWVSPTFAPVAVRLGCQEFLETIQKIAQSYPSIPGIEQDIKDAIEATQA